jgi:hypothetical protein
MIKYRAGYKYQTAEDYTIQTGIIPPGPIDNIAFLSLSETGELWIRCGYAWDGISGPTFDTESTRRGSLVHDALYQLMREGYLDPAIYKEQADRLFCRICVEDAKWPRLAKARAAFDYQGLRIGGWAATQPRQNEVLFAGAC